MSVEISVRQSRKEINARWWFTRTPSQRQAILAYRRGWIAANRERLLARRRVTSAAWRSANREHVNARQRANYAARRLKEGHVVRARNPLHKVSPGLDGHVRRIALQDPLMVAFRPLKSEVCEDLA